MEFCLLGPVEALDGDRPMALGGGKQRALLAILLLEANRVVSSERLIDLLWGDEPSASAGHAVQVYVSRLRKALGERLETRAPGYVLRADPEEIDLERFSRLTAEGRRALAAGDPDAASALLVQALSLWRGSPLANVADEPFAGPQVARLEELRASALEDRIDADLALGRHAQLLGELQGEVAAHPWRERLRGQLMLALYRSGRQADALDAYRQARQALLDELGLEPGRELRELERAILQQDVSLEAPVAPSRTAEPAPPPVPQMPRFRSERKMATVVFAGLGHAPATAGEEDPERVRQLHTRFFEAVAREFEEAGGSVERTLPHALMAAFGAPRALEDHAARAVRAALALRRRIVELFEGQLGISLGIASGEVLVEVDDAGGFAVSGEAVPVAARLEQAAREGEVLVSERTVAASKGLFRFSAAVSTEGAKAFGHRRLLGAAPAGLSAPLAGLPRTFVGRSEELEMLEATLRRAIRGGEAHLATVIGEPGIGKTSLVREFLGRLAFEAEPPLVRSGRCLAYGRGITYWPLGEILREHLGIGPAAAPEDVLEQLPGREILGLTLGLDMAGEIHPKAARDRLHEAWIGLVEEMAPGPVVLLVEDLHWAEEPLLDLLEELVPGVRGPVTLFTTARPELMDRRPSWGGGRGNSTILRLEPLSPAEATSMMTSLLEVEPGPEVRDLVVRRSEGNPFFLEELLATLIDRGALVRDRGRWVLRDVDAEAVPESIRALLAARVDLLPPPEKAILQAASVVGRTFGRRPVEELLGGVSPGYATLEGRGFIRRLRAPDRPDEPAFIFKHALTREVAYATLAKADRARLHAAHAEWLERSGGGRDEDAPMLAHHYAEAVRPEDADLAWEGEEERLRTLEVHAAGWLRRAAELAVGRYSIDEGLDLYRRALELERDRERQAELWQGVGRAHALRYEGGEMWAALRQAVDLTERPELRAEAFGDLAFETAARWGMLNPMPERQVVDGWIEETLELAAPTSPARAKALIARCLWYPHRADESSAEAVQIAEGLGDPDLLSHAWNARACAAFVAGRYEESRGWAERRLGLLENITDPDHIVDVYSGVIPGHAGVARFDEARRFADLHDGVARTLSPHHQMHAVAMVLEVEELRAAWDAVLALERRAEAAVEANRDTACVRNPRSLLVCAVANEHMGDRERSLALEAAAADVGKEGFERSLASLWIQLALLRRDLDDVRRLLVHAVSPPPAKNWWQLTTLATRLDALATLADRERVEEEAPPLLVPGTYLEPFATRALGLVRQDARLLEEAAAHFEALDLPWHAGRTRAMGDPAPGPGASADRPLG